jgi:hypothetical protein
VSKFGFVTRGLHTAEFEVVGKIITVRSVFGVKRAKLGDLPTEVSARGLLGDQIREASIAN